MSAEIDIAIIGAGIVGLAIAAELGSLNREIMVFERHSSFGQETSSRNSEVIHAGIYYPHDSLKTRLCIEGNRKLYEICKVHKIPHKKTGKIILASDQSEIKKLDSIFKQGVENGVNDLVFLSEQDIIRLEPNIHGKAGILSPSTGIVNTHSLMKLFYHQATEKGVDFLFNSQVIDLEKSQEKWKITLRDWEGISELSARVVINCAGLHSDKISELAGINREDYRIHFCKGDYFRLEPKWRNAVNHLIYPVPEQSGLGVHLTIDLNGMLRLGPDATYVEGADYHVNEAQKQEYYRSLKKFFPSLILEDISPDYSGIRPKLQGPNDTFRDFVISHEDGTGCEGLINLIGIESPGITAAPAIASYVANLIIDINS